MINQVQKLREITSAGVMECKKALEDVNGDFDKALTLIHERGLTRAEKRRKNNRRRIASFLYSQ